ncbi:MAG: transglycosylase domain-containing protein, partial [Chthoniobacterales bacterium]|nr:transglycosylase domain-containing protein [Chthoniobacterales bacterium]
FRNLLAGRKAEGGSTITQQLVKNHFLSPEKTIERKAKELVMSVLLETELTKDQILELYLNVIYMGQNGPLRVHGYGAAARFYFGRPIGELELHECALLAAIVNSPGTYHPTRHPDRTKLRRNTVLDKMHNLGFIDPSSKERAQEKPLPSSPAKLLMAAETAPYFLDGLREQVKALGIPFVGLKIHSSLRQDHQFVAQKALQEHLQRLSRSHKNLVHLAKNGKRLEGVFLSANPKTGLISAAVGGQSYRLTQFNRTLWARRQMGSTIKPFVFLT